MITQVRTAVLFAAVVLCAAGGVSAQEHFPPTPEMSEVYNQVGWYLSLPKMIPVLLLYFVWVYSANWVNRDAQERKAKAERWNLLVLFSGLAGLALVWIIPIYLVALPAAAIALFAPPLTYIGIRNGRVPESERVLTSDHLARLWGESLARAGLGGPRPGQAARSRGDAESLRFQPISGNGDESLKRQAGRFAADEQRLLIAKELMADAIERRATDIHLEPKNDEIAIRYRIDGLLHNAEPYDRPTGDEVMQIFKGIGGLVVAEKRKPQEGRLQVTHHGRDIEVRVASRGTREGESMRLRILDKRVTVSKLGDLGMRTKLQETVAGFMKQPKGLFLVAGPDGAGTTTTLYAALREIDRFQRNVISLEDSIEYEVENVDQIEIGAKVGEERIAELRRALRNEPDALMIGEFSEAPVAQLACQAASDRLVLSSLKANDTMTALFRVLDLQVERNRLAKVLLGIMAQRLVRRLCDACKEPYRPRPEFLKKANIPANKVDVFYRPPREPQEVCNVCAGTGYYGRTGLFELLVANEAIRRLIRESGSVNAIKAEARKNGMLYLQEEGLRLVIRGVTSIQELMRVVK